MQVDRWPVYLGRLRVQCFSQVDDGRGLISGRTQQLGQLLLSSSLENEGKEGRKQERKKGKAWGEG